MSIQTIAMGLKPAALWLQATNSDRLTPDQRFELGREALQHPNSGGFLVGLLVPVCFFAMIVLIIWLGTRYKQARMKMYGETRKQLLDKFGSAQELTTFLESKIGQQFLHEMKSQSDGRLRFVPGGVITTMLGLAFLGLTLMHRNFIVPAVILLSLGTGFLISAAIYYKLGPKGTDFPVESGSGSHSIGPV